jgi:hypothetical protein
VSLNAIIEPDLSKNTFLRDAVIFQLTTIKNIRRIYVVIASATINDYIVAMKNYEALRSKQGGYMYELSLPGDILAKQIENHATLESGWTV